jgi:pimeloyl-ACP methyl ester carboxylesterase
MSLLDRLFAGEHFVLDGRVRETLPGRTAWLTDGVTYYETAGPENGNPVIFIHGFSVPNFIWDRNFTALADAGFRAVRYDLFGRGYSDRPKIAYNKALFVRQLADLLDALKIDQADLVSLSMGGPIAAEFAYRFPKRVRKLVFLDPAGFDLELPLTVKLLNVPVLGETMLGLLGLLGTRTLLETMLNDFYSPSQDAKQYFIPRYLEQMKYYGFKRAILSSLRTGMLDEDLQLFQRIADLNKPVMLIWGKEDQTVPFKHSATFMQIVPTAEFHAIDQAKHIPQFERPEIVNPLLINFLKQ